MNSMLSEPMVDHQTRDKIETRAWIDRILSDKNWTPTDFARHADLAPSTLLRFLNDKRNKHSLTFSTIKKLSDASGYDVPGSLLAAQGITTTEIAKDRTRTLTADGDMSPGTVPLVRVSNFPDGLQPAIRERHRVPKPRVMVGDTTAFAFHMPDDSLGPMIPARSLMYASKLREIGDGDLVLITDTSGISTVRMVKAVSREGVVLDQKGRLEMPYERIREYGIVRVIERPA